MNYLDVYFSRINHLGNTTSERIRNGGIRSFEKWMAESPHTVRDLSVERGIYFDGIILTSKDKEYEKIMFLEVANDIPLLIGDIMNWTLDDGSIEKWILIQEEKKVNGTFRSFWIIRCNYLIKWIDSLGHLNESWAYFVSSLDSKIKANFRTWNSLITPQPNKYAEILMPRYSIARSTNFIIEDESWSVVEYDHSSVPGVIYLSLTENKINFIYDDTNNNIADLDKLSKYLFVLPEEKQVFSVGENLLEKLKFSLTKNGAPYDAPVNILSTSSYYVKKEKQGDQEGLYTKHEGTDIDIVLQLKDYPSITQTIKIDIGEQEQAFSAYINGPDQIKLSRRAEYCLESIPVSIENYIFAVYHVEVIANEDIDNPKYQNYKFFNHPKISSYSLGIQMLPNETGINKYKAEEKMGTIKFDTENQKWVFSSNSDNKLGYVVLGCCYTYSNEELYEFKTIEITSLW